MNNVTIAYMGDCEEPSYETADAAGCDLRSSIDVELPVGGRFLIPTGLFVTLTPGFEGQIRPRSGLAYKHGITVLNAPGTVDSDYRGEIKVLLINHGGTPYLVKKGDRIAQFVISPVMRGKFVKMQSLPSSTRGEGGFGSTGK